MAFPVGITLITPMYFKGANNPTNLLVFNPILDFTKLLQLS